MGGLSDAGSQGWEAQETTFGHLIGMFCRSVDPFVERESSGVEVGKDITPALDRPEW